MTHAWTILAAIVAVLAISCASDGFYDQLDEHSVLSPVPAKGSDTTLDIATWNIEWLGDSSRGPSDEILQRGNAIDIIGGTDFDLWGLEEIVDAGAFDQIVAKLPGYDGFLASDPMVENGPAHYNSGEQKVGILFKADVIKPLGARLILTERDYQFAGRPPLEVRVQATIGGTSEELVVIVLHAKATTSASSWQRRKDASAALHAYLDSAHPEERVVVIGDFNDDVDTSIRSGQPSPYQNFIDDPASYFFPTEALSLAGATSTTHYSDVIDHHLVTSAMAGRYIADSAAVYLVDEHVAEYDGTTSDHYPVLSRYEWGKGGQALVFINEVCANEPGGSTAGEFIELYNAGTAPADLSGWTLADSASARHVFADGTVLNPGQAIAVFGGASAIPAGLDNAVVASTGGLSLRNSGERITLKSGDGVAIGALDYSAELASQDGVSMNREVDGDGASGFVLHTSTSVLPASPGRRSDGSAW